MPRGGLGRSVFEEPTRLGEMDAHLIVQARSGEISVPSVEEYPPKFLPANTELAPMHFDEPLDEDATRLSPIEPVGRRQPARGAGNDERTRAVDIRHDPGINDIDWDID
jgi:hypothetical protein